MRVLEQTVVTNYDDVGLRTGDPWWGENLAAAIMAQANNAVDANRFIRTRDFDSAGRPDGDETLLTLSDRRYVVVFVRRGDVWHHRTDYPAKPVHSRHLRDAVHALVGKFADRWRVPDPTFRVALSNGGYRTDVRFSAPERFGFRCGKYSRNWIEE